MPCRSTTNQIFTLRQILEKTQEYRTTTHHLFIDLSYESMIRSELLLAMDLLYRNSTQAERWKDVVLRDLKFKATTANRNLGNWREAAQKPRGTFMVCGGIKSKVSNKI